MQEDLVILLEWLNANGINDIFNSAIDDNEEIKSNIISITQDKSLNTVFNQLSIQQQNLRENNIFSNDINTVRELSNSLNNLDDILKNIQTIKEFENKRRLANNTIVLQGKPKNKILVVNDLPTEEDDENDKIFSGEAGELLKKMFNAIHISEDEYTLMNIFFWRLAGGRMPIKEELNLCKPFVEKIISLVEPEIIICMGNYAVSSLINENETVIKARGHFYDYTNMYLQKHIKTTAIYSPNFLLKNTSKKREAWNDLQEIEKLCEVK